MKKFAGIVIVVLSLAAVNIHLAYSEEVNARQAELLGTWSITNETTDGLYEGTVGQVTFSEDSLTIDFGRFAAAGIVAASEDAICPVPLDPISYKRIGNSTIYLSWQAESRSSTDLYDSDAVITIVKHEGNRLTLVGQGGCGRTGVPRISYLEKVE